MRKSILLAVLFVCVLASVAAVLESGWTRTTNPATARTALNVPGLTNNNVFAAGTSNSFDTLTVGNINTTGGQVITGTVSGMADIYRPDASLTVNRSSGHAMIDIYHSRNGVSGGSGGAGGEESVVNFSMKDDGGTAQQLGSLSFIWARANATTFASMWRLHGQTQPGAGSASAPSSNSDLRGGSGIGIEAFGTSDTTWPGDRVFQITDGSLKLAGNGILGPSSIYHYNDILYLQGDTGGFSFQNSSNAVAMFTIDDVGNAAFAGPVSTTSLRLVDSGVLWPSSIYRYNNALYLQGDTNGFSFQNSSNAIELLTINDVGNATFSGSLNALSLKITGGTAATSTIWNNANRMIFQSDTGGYLFQNSSNTANIVAILDDTTVNFASGSVGIGTATPAAVLPDGFLAGLNSKMLTIKSADTSHDVGLFLRRADDNLGLDLWTDGSGGSYIDDRWDYFPHSLKFRMRTAGTPVVAMTILGSGNVGIGTTTPVAKLDVNGNIKTVLTNVSLATDGNGIIVSGGGSGINLPLTVNTVLQTNGSGGGVLNDGLERDFSVITNFSTEGRSALQWRTASTYSWLGADINGNLIFELPSGTKVSIDEDFEVVGDAILGVTTVGGGTAIASILSATATLNFGSILAATSADLTITVTGAAVNDAVQLGPPAGLEGSVAALGIVTAANTVTVRLLNIGAISVDPASATWRATVTHY